MSILQQFKRAPEVSRLQCGLIELKFSGADDKEMQFEGYGAVFGNVDSYGDVIEKGAFKNTIREAKATGDWPAMLSQHGAWGMTSEDLTPIGVWMDMEEDDKGLFMKGKLAPTPRGQELYTLMKMSPRPAINGLSIGYLPIKFKMRGSPDEPRRTLQELKLIEISPVTFPANPAAQISTVKSAIGALNTLADVERHLREQHGVSKAEAVALVSHIKAIAGRSDSNSAVDLLPGLEALQKSLRGRSDSEQLGDLLPGLQALSASLT